MLRGLALLRGRGQAVLLHSSHCPLIGQESIDELLNSQNCNSLVGQRESSVAYDSMAGTMELKQKPQHAHHLFWLLKHESSALLPGGRSKSYIVKRGFPGMIQLEYPILILNGFPNFPLLLYHM